MGIKVYFYSLRISIMSRRDVKNQNIRGLGLELPDIRDSLPMVSIVVPSWGYLNPKP